MFNFSQRFRGTPQLLDDITTEEVACSSQEAGTSDEYQDLISDGEPNPDS